MERGVRFPHHVGFVAKTNTGHCSPKERRRKKKRKKEKKTEKKKKKTGPKLIAQIMNEYSRRRAFNRHV